MNSISDIHSREDRARHRAKQLGFKLFKSRRSDRIWDGRVYDMAEALDPNQLKYHRNTLEEIEIILKHLSKEPGDLLERAFKAYRDGGMSLEPATRSCYVIPASDAAGRRPTAVLVNHCRELARYEWTGRRLVRVPIDPALAA
ncbi:MULTISPECIES: hypothetical protein [unclassified Inquilinus]|uniref:hypothetical protein n=1 Tax=unclassified Inquilinus TaxID=2645927 RepID=UPI003F91CC1F